MQFTTLPGTGISVSRLCLGTMTFGSPVAEPDAIRLVHDAAELGVNFIDTANMYEGYNRFAGSAGGVAEEIVGKAVAGRRADFVVATKLGMKVGDTPVDENTSPEAIRVQLRRSLRRINTDYIDLYYLHRYDPNTAPGEIARAMLYMEGAYAPVFRMSDRQRRLAQNWNEQHPVVQWECTRAARIEKLQGNVNPVVKDACLKAGLTYRP